MTVESKKYEVINSVGIAVTEEGEYTDLTLENLFNEGQCVYSYRLPPTMTAITSCGSCLLMFLAEIEHLDMMLVHDVYISESSAFIIIRKTDIIGMSPFLLTLTVDQIPVDGYALIYATVSDC